MVRCVGWDSTFCVPINDLSIPCHLTPDTLNEHVQLLLCPDGVTLAMIGGATLVVYALRCSEPSLASVLGCGRGQALSPDAVPTTSTSTNANTSLCVLSYDVNSDALSGSFSRTTGRPLEKMWSRDNGTFNARGRDETEALRSAVGSGAAQFNEVVLKHLNGSPLLSHNFVRKIVDACHSHGAASWPVLMAIIETGRVSAWACPMLVDTLLSSSKKRATIAKKKSTKKKKKIDKVGTKGDE
jgi:hypothetical protein